MTSAAVRSPTTSNTHIHTFSLLLRHMTSAAVLFYGRRSRSSRTFDDLGFGSSGPLPLSSSSSSSSSSTADLSSSSNHHHRHRHRRGDLHRRHRHINFDDSDQFRHSFNASHVCGRTPIAESEPHQRDCNEESSSREINNRETVRGLNGRYHRNNQLPGSVLLARERLVQRLRGVSVSGIRDARETAQSLPSNDQGVVDADWETSVSREESASYTNLTDVPVGAHQSVHREPQTKPRGLTDEALSKLHLEVFVEQQNLITQPMSKASTECSICLENFVEGNKLINLPCGHRFHTSCLYPWLQTCGECPYCRSCIMLT